MTVAEYQQAQKDIEEIRAQISQLRDVVAKGVPAMRGVYGMDQPEVQQPTAEPQPAPSIMSAHEPVGTPNVNPFQDNFTPNTNTASMQEIAGQVAPQPDQPLGERLARGAANIPIGMAAMAEQATSDPAGFAKSTGEYLNTWAKRLNPNILSPESIQANQEFGQQMQTDPVGTTLDVAGVAGTALGLPELAGKIGSKFKSIKEARAAIKDIGKPKVDVAEVAQKPITSETPTVEQPTTAPEVVAKAKPNAVTGNVKPLTPDELTAAQARLREKFKPMDEAVSEKAPSTQPVENPVVAETPNVGEQKALSAGVHPNAIKKLNDAMNNDFGTTDLGNILHPSNKNLRVLFTEKTGVSLPKTVSGTKNAIEEWALRTKPELRSKVRAEIEKNYPDKIEAFDAKYGAGKISTEQPTATVQDAGATPAQSTKPESEYEAFLKKHEAARADAKAQADKEIAIKQANDTITKANEDARLVRVRARAKETAPPIPTTAEAVVKKAGEQAQRKKGKVPTAQPVASAVSEITTEAFKQGNRASFKRVMIGSIDDAIRDAKSIIDYGGENLSSLSKQEARNRYFEMSRDGRNVGGTMYKIGGSTPKITIHIPDDGDFTIYNTVEHLSELKKRVGLGLGTKSKSVGEYTFNESYDSADPISIATGKKIFSGENPFLSKEQMAKYLGGKNAESPVPTELHSGVNPFKIIDDYMTKRKLVNPVGTPEHVLSGKGIVEPFRRAQEAMRNETKARGEKLQEVLKGVKRGSDESHEIFRNLNDPEAELGPREKAVRQYLDDFLATVNEHRVKRGQDPVKYRKGYITHLFDAVEKNASEFGETPMPKRYRFQFEKARTNAPGYKVDIIDALEAYTKAALKDIYIGDALHEAIPLVESLGDKPITRRSMVKTQDGKTINMTFYDWTNSPIVTERGYAESFIKGQMNIPTSGQRALEAMFGIKPNTATKSVLAITGRFYQSLLGLAVDSGVKNLTQGINTAAELGLLPTLKGYVKLATAKGLKVARSEHLLEDFNPLLMEDVDLTFKSKAARVVAKGASATLNAPMKVAEFINRGAAYHAAYDSYIKKGMPLEQAHEAARLAVRKTQFSYSKIDTSPALRGPFARLFSQFFSYPIKQSEMLYKWAVKPGEQSKLIRYFLYTGMAVMGAKYAGVDLSGVFFDPIRMVDPNSKEGVQLPGSDKRVTFDASKLGKTGYTPQGFAPSLSIPADFIKSQTSDDEYTRKEGRKKALFSVLPGGRYGKKVYDVLTESDERGKRDRITRENTDKEKVLKLLGFRGTDREAESSRRQSVADVEKVYYATRQKMIDLVIKGDKEEFAKVRDGFKEKYPFLYGRLMKGFSDSVNEERKKKGMTTDERFFDNSLRKQIERNL